MKQKYFLYQLCWESSSKKLNSFKTYNCWILTAVYPHKITITVKIYNIFIISKRFLLYLCTQSFPPPPAPSHHLPNFCHHSFFLHFYKGNYTILSSFVSSIFFLAKLFWESSMFLYVYIVYSFLLLSSIPLSILFAF